MELAIELEHETFGDYVRRVSIVSVLVITFFVYPTICQAVLNTFACFHIDTGNGDYSLFQRVRVCHCGVWRTDDDDACFARFDVDAWVIHALKLAV